MNDFSFTEITNYTTFARIDSANFTEDVSFAKKLFAEISYFKATYLPKFIP